MKRSDKKRLEKISRLPVTIQQVVLGAFLTKFFVEKDVKLTLVGGATVQFYTQAAYLTHDVDIILHGDTKEIIEEVMGKLGFKRTTMYRHFEHSFFNFVVEFPPAPIEVGSRVIHKVNVIKTDEGPVRIIKIEDIIMDRIVAGVEWKDEPSIEQAKLLWIKNKKIIDKNYLTDFARKEGYLKTLQEVMRS